MLHDFPRIQLGIAASLHEKMIVPTSGRSQEQENCREMGPPATSSLRTTGNGTFPGNPLQAHFGVSAAKKYDLVVLFPSGIEVALKDVAAGQALKVAEQTK